MPVTLKDNKSKFSNVIQADRKLSDEWYTPPEIIQALGPFDLDPACGPNAPRTAKRVYQSRGLERPWFGRVWMNPPFSNTVPWIDRMIEHGDGVALVFCRTEAKWFQRALDKTRAVFIFRGRTRFSRPSGLPSGDPPFGCCLLPFGRENLEAVRKSGLDGAILRL